MNENSAGLDAAARWERLSARLAAVIEKRQSAGQNAEEVLRARARRLAARRSTDTDKQDAGVEYIAFRRGEERYALEIDWVQAVLELRHAPVPVPQAPAHLLGLIRVRGMMTALFDLEALLAAGNSDNGAPTRAVLVGRQENAFALAADVLEGMREIVKDQLVPLPEAMASRHGDLVRGIAGDGLVVIDGEALAADARLIIGASPKTEIAEEA
ncbi:MAG: hypothetical protein DRQ37_02495 [Gammaproteobacteria bacterium]|nr:MAG: hypothetical protein DRQ37_02495 [Gammaproteobacteria bacterium]